MALVKLTAGSWCGGFAEERIPLPMRAPEKGGRCVLGLEGSRYLVRRSLFTVFSLFRVYLGVKNLWIVVV